MSVSLPLTAAPLRQGRGARRRGNPPRNASRKLGTSFAWVKALTGAHAGKVYAERQITKMISQYRYFSAVAAALLAFAAAVAFAPHAAKAGALPYSYLNISRFTPVTSAPGTHIKISNLASDLSVAPGGPDMSDAGDLQLPSADDSQRCGGSCGSYEDLALSLDGRSSRADWLTETLRSPNRSGLPAGAHGQQLAPSNAISPGADNAPTRAGHAPSFPFDYAGPPGGPGIGSPLVVDPEIFTPRDTPANDVLDDPPGAAAPSASLAIASAAEPKFPGIFGVLSLVAGLYLRRRNRA
jgi:hypothetical protein